ncbi:hypothetical protein [Pseudalkalibacillus sp. SCS-8]|uniref:hypothetical protein n=1 Tax=Pseudalkalibacillus nanhaiensis TaxID=3115291 RepID=UPI0032DB84BA
MKNRLILSLLAALALVYFAIPYLPEMEPGLSGWFSAIWLIFAVVVIGGNLSALMFRKYPQAGSEAAGSKRIQKERRKVRQH